MTDQPMDQTPNPFDALGGGGFDMNALLQQAQQMQEQLQSAQARLSETVVDGTVAGGTVTVQVNGVCPRITAEKRDVARGGAQRAQQNPDRGGLPRAVRA